MPYVLPRLPLAAKPAFALMRYFLKDICGYTEIQADDGSGSSTFGLQVSGTGASVSISQPNILNATGSPFSTSYAGMYCVTYGSSIKVNNGIFRIASVPTSNQIILTPSVYGPRFLSDATLKFRIVDPTTAVTNNPFYTMQAPNPSGTVPNWQIKIYNNLADTTTIRFQVGPMGGWSTSLIDWAPGTLTTTAAAWDQDSTPIWYLLADSYNMFGWTENTAASGVFDAMMAGSAQTFNAGFDGNFAIGIAGTPGITSGSMFSSFTAVDYLNQNMTTHTGCKPISTFAGSPNDNLFASLNANQFDLRRDTADILVATDNATSAAGQEIRGVVRSYHYCSTQVAYKAFVNNNRTLVSLGQGLCVDWDPNLPQV